MEKKFEKIRNLTTASISDALDSLKIEGALLNIHPLCMNRKIVGQAFTVKYESIDEPLKTYHNAGNYIDDVGPGNIIVLDNQGKTDCTTWGDIMTHVSLKKGIQGAVINGVVRDVSKIKEHGFPVYSKGVFMRSGKSRVRKINQQCPLEISGVKINPGDIIFGDENGVVVIPLEHIDEILKRAQKIEKTETCIIEAVDQGVPLKKARSFFRYDQPWLGQTKCMDKKTYA